MLLSGWASTRSESVAWITLDDRDNDPATLWANLSRAFAGSARDTARGYLVLDSAQSLTARQERGLVPRIVDWLPPSVHLLIASRSPAPLALHRLRVEKDAVELNAGDLRFTIDEAAELFADPLYGGVDVPALVEHTNGWATGLALALRHEPAERVEGRSHEFLRDEVFARESEDVRQFLMETAFLEYMTAAASERITKRVDAADLIRHLERENAFISRVDGDHRRYAYQDQFRDMLRDELRARDPGRVEAIHAESARWCEERGLIAEAMEHWLSAGREYDALRLLRRANLAFGDTRLDLIAGWVSRIDAAAARGELPLLLDLAASYAVIRDDVRFRDLMDRVGVALEGIDRPGRGNSLRPPRRSTRALGTGEIESFVASLERARALLAADPALIHDPALALLPRARRLSGWLALGQSWLERTGDARTTLRDRPFAPLEEAVDRLFASSVAAAISFNEGHLDEAEKLALNSTRTAAELGVDHSVVWPASHVIAAMMHERDDLDGARLAFETLIETMSEPTGNVFSIAAQVSYANVLRSQGDVSEALELLSRLRRDHLPETRTTTHGWVDRATVLTLLRLGQIHAAREVLGPPQHRDSETITAALVELADGNADAASRLGGTVRRDTPRARLLAALIDAQAAALRGDNDASIAGAEKAMYVAQRYGLLRTVLDYGSELLPIFGAVSSGPGDTAFVARLRRAQRHAPETIEIQGGAGSRELTARELEVLSYLPTHLSIREIATALYVSPNTVKSHAQHVYRKLGVDSREAAVGRARAMQLFL